MALVTCRVCQRQVSDAAHVCVHCGSALWAPAAPPRETPAPWPAHPGAAVALESPYLAPPAAVAEDELHPLAIHKLVLLSIFTLGLYELYWFYRNWKRVRARTGEDISPFWRAFFAPLWAYSMFEEVDRQALAQQMEVGWSSIALGAAYFLLSAAWRLPDPWSLITFVGFLPLLPVQASINAMAARRGVRADDSFDGRHYAAFAVGSLLLLLAVAGTLLPQ
ncbi:MAG TPA: DUF4234 domain-containing protein [Longimicrobium sp.]